MPINAPGQRHTAVCSRAGGVLHGQIVVEDNHVGTAFKVSVPSRFQDPLELDNSQRRVIQVIVQDEEYEIQVGGIHEAPRADHLNGAIVGDKIFIDSGDNTLLLAPGGTDEAQTVTINATSGTFTLALEGDVTAAIAFDASAAALRGALEGLPAVNPGDVTVTKSGSVFTVTFVAGDYAGADAPALVSDATNLAGGAHTAVVATTVPGAAGAGIPVGVVDDVDTVRDVVLINSNAWQAFLPGA